MRSKVERPESLLLSCILDGEAYGVTYQLSIGTVAGNGNRVFVEVGFETE